MRELKRYNNRRLYDFSTSRYTTLHDLRELVRKDIPFRARDVKGKDITLTVLADMVRTHRYATGPRAHLYLSRMRRILKELS